jgi:hypothetical protein
MGDDLAALRTTLPLPPLGRHAVLNLPIVNGV